MLGEVCSRRIKALLYISFFKTVVEASNKWINMCVGCKVLVELFASSDEARMFGAEAEASERTILEHDNNYR